MVTLPSAALPSPHFEQTLLEVAHECDVEIKLSPSGLKKHGQAGREALDIITATGRPLAVGRLLRLLLRLLHGLF